MSIDIISIGKERANFAWKQVNSRKSMKNAKEYKSLLRRIPMLIRTNGLGATSAYLFSKKGKKSKNHFDHVCEDLTNWLKKRGFDVSDDIVSSIIDYDTPEYVAATEDILELLAWMRRFADGLFEE